MRLAPRFFADAAIAIFAFWTVWVWGHQGFFLLDQSAVFDGAWRVLQGEAPYKDFLMPFGPVTFWIQAAFFRIAGVNFSSMVLAAAVLNSLAALMSMRIVRLLVPQFVGPSYATGVLTALWFQAPFGTLWFEQVGFFFDMAALLALLEAGLTDRRRMLAFNCAAGAAAALAFLSKQNAGGFFFFVLIGVTCLRYRPRLVIAFAAQAAGFVAVSGVFAIWLWAKSDPRQFIHYFFEIAAQIAADRSPGLMKTLWATLTLHHTLVLPWVYYLVMAIAVFAFFRRRFEAGFLLCGVVFFQDAFVAVTVNEPQNAQPFLGVAIGLCIGLLMLQAGKYWLLGVALFLACADYGLWADRERVVLGFRDNTKFAGPLKVRGLERLWWGEPTKITAKESISKADFEALNAWIDSHPGPFFVFPDTTILYALHGQRAPQPWLYFCEGHSFLSRELGMVDARVQESLERSGIQTVILEKASWMGNHQVLEKLPRTRGWIDREFAKETEFSIYDVWTRKK